MKKVAQAKSINRAVANDNVYRNKAFVNFPQNGKAQGSRPSYAEERTEALCVAAERGRPEHLRLAFIYV